MNVSFILNSSKNQVGTWAFLDLASGSKGKFDKTLAKKLSLPSGHVRALECFIGASPKPSFYSHHYLLYWNLAGLQAARSEL